MLSFIEFLQEKINFAKGRDNDFFYHNYAIITLVKGDIKWLVSVSSNWYEK